VLLSDLPAHKPLNVLEALIPATNITY
jgi:hypothetical protein